MAGADYTRNILLIQNLGRVKNSFSHRAPFYYYLIHFPETFCPGAFLSQAQLLFLERRHQGRSPICYFLGLVYWRFYIFLIYISKRIFICCRSIQLQHFWWLAFVWKCDLRKDRATKNLPTTVTRYAASFFGVLMVCSIGIPISYLLKLRFADDLGLPGDILYCMSVFTFCAVLWKHFYFQ